MQNPAKPRHQSAVATDAIASYLRAIALALEARGVSSKQLFSELDIAANPDGDPLERVPSSVVAALFQRAVRMTGDPLFGLDVARHIRARNMHALAGALLVSSSLREFCMRLVRYWRFWTNAGSPRLADGPDSAYLAIDDLSDASAYESEDATLVYLVRLMLEASDGRFTPTRMTMRRPCPPDGGAAHRAALSCPIEFGCSNITIQFDSGDLDIPWPGGSREVAQANEEVVVRYTAKLATAALDAQVLGLLIERFATRPLTKADVAHELSMSISTLQQGLAKLGTSYSAIVETARTDLAMADLEEGRTPIKEISFKLGFSSPSNFSRAFKRWTGMSPLQFRATAMRGEDSTAGTPS